MQRWYRPWIYGLFLLSGISGLVYETVWLRILSRVLGSTVYATAIVLASYMAGLALGSYLFGRWAAARRDLLRVYALLELCIGLAALLLTAVIARLLPLYRLLYAASGESRLTLSLAQSVVLFLLLLVPTLLMGGTLPVLTGYTRSGGGRIVDRLGALYGLNTLGAMIGVLFSGLYAIGAIGEWRTLCLGVIINIGVALIAWIWAAGRASGGEIPAAVDTNAVSEPASDSAGPRRRLILLVYGISGFVAISYEIVWTRMFQVQLGTSIYSFSLMLACYLLGIGAGSLVGSRWRRLRQWPLASFSIAQGLIALLGIAGMFLFTRFDPVAYNLTLRLDSIVLMPLLLVTPLTFLLGVILPSVARAYIGGEDTATADTGRLYSVNTIGCIAGSLATGFLLIGLLGTRGTIIALSGLNLALAWLIAWARNAPGRPIRLNALLAVVSVMVAVMAVAAPDPFLSTVYKLVETHSRVKPDQIQLFFHHEGTVATTTAFTVNTGQVDKDLWINGIGMTQLCTETKIMAHLPLLLHPDPRDILVICMGMGTALRSAWTHHQVSCDVVEIVPEVYRCFPFFHHDGQRILADPRVRHFVDDGRNFLLMRDRPYDVITMDPAPPLYSAGTVNLYTVEFFRLCRRHLRPGGIMCLWIPPDRFSEVRMIMKSFTMVFPQSLVWGGPRFPGLYLTGFNGPIVVHPERFRSADRDTALVADLTELDTLVPRPSAIPRLLVLDQPLLTRFVAGAQTITDDVPYTEFPIWRSRSDSSYGWDLNAVTLREWATLIQAVQ